MRHKLHLRPSGYHAEINAEEFILDALEAQGFRAPHACRTASCGACRAKKLSGEFTYPENETLHGLSAEEIAEGYLLPCAAFAQSDLVLEWEDVLAPGERAVQRLTLPVIGVEPMAADLWRVRLQLPPSTRPRFDAGQYLMLVMPEGNEHAFSIASGPQQRELELHVRAVEGHDAARAIVEHFQRRQMVTVKLPLGRAGLRTGDAPVLMIAGGTGITPMRSMLQSLIAEGHQRPVALYWGASEPEQLYLLDEFSKLAVQHAWFHFTPVLSGTHAEWKGARGFPHEQALRETPDLASRQVYVSGSEPMVRVVYQALRAAGVADAQVHSDWLDLLDIRQP